MRYHEGRYLRIIRMLRFLVRKVENMAGELDALRAQVARNTEVDASAIVLLRGIKAALDAAIAAGDPAALTELSNSLGASTDQLAAAVAENTLPPEGGASARRR
jgi:hypothetical protein